MADQHAPIRPLLPRIKPWMVGALAGAAGSLVLVGLASLALLPLTAMYEECHHANPPTGSGNLSGGVCTPLVIANVAAMALRIGPAAYPLTFLPVAADPLLLAPALSALIAAVLAGICCVVLPLRKGLVAALVLYLAGLLPYMCFFAVMVDTG